jgi:hypothetical protein
MADRSQRNPTTLCGRTCTQARYYFVSSMLIIPVLSSKHSTDCGLCANGVKPRNFQTETLPSGRIAKHFTDEDAPSATINPEERFERCPRQHRG